MEDTKQLGKETIDRDVIGREMKLEYQPFFLFLKALKSSKPSVQGNKFIDVLKGTALSIPPEESIRYIPSFSM